MVCGEQVQGVVAHAFMLRARTDQETEQAEKVGACDGRAWVSARFSCSLRSAVRSRPSDAARGLLR